MKKLLIGLTSALALSIGVTAIGEQSYVSLNAEDANITTYLVLSSVGRYNGEKGEDFASPLYLENTIKFEAKAGTALPGKEAITAPNTAGEFDHWEAYEGTGFPTVYDKVPAESGKILYAFYSNTGEEPGPGPGPGPSEEGTYYLNTGGSSLWNQASAWFALYMWNNSGESTWYTMDHYDGDIWSVTIDTDTYTTGIFVRMDPSYLEPDWSGKWNQTEDLTFGSDNCYTITAWGSSTDVGSWSSI